MAEISGVIVDFEVSPRIAIVPISLDAVTVQDLHDTLTNIQGRPESMSFSDLIDSAGKEELTDIEAVGITATLQNAKLAFAARPGPDYVQCAVEGGNLVAVDAGGIKMNPFEPTAFTQIAYAKSSSATSLDIGALTVVKFIAMKNL